MGSSLSSRMCTLCFGVPSKRIPRTSWTATSWTSPSSAKTTWVDVLYLEQEWSGLKKVWNNGKEHCYFMAFFWKLLFLYLSMGGGKHVASQHLLVVSSCSLWLAGIELRESGLVTSTFTYWAISLVRKIYFHTTIIYMNIECVGPYFKWTWTFKTFVWMLDMKKRPISYFHCTLKMSRFKKEAIVH